MFTHMILETPQMPQWSEIMSMFETAAKLLGLGAVFVAGILWIVKTFKTLKEPQRDLESRVSTVEEHLDNDYKRFARQDKLNEQQAEVDRLLLRSVLAMQSHMLDGNHTKEMTQCRDDINRYLLNR